LTSSTVLKNGDSSHDRGDVLLVRGSLARQSGRLPALPRHVLPRFTAKAIQVSAWLSPTFSIVAHRKLSGVLMRLL